MDKIDLRKIFDDFNSKTGNKLVCKKLYIVPAMRHWIDATDPKNPQVIIANLCWDKSPYKITKIMFNPDITNEKIVEILKDFLAKTLVIGDNWDHYLVYKSKMTDTKEENKQI